METKTGLARSEKIRAMFDEISPTYDKLNRLLSFGLDAKWRRFLLSKLPAGKGRILDCCTGTGELAVLLAGCGHEVIGVDISRPMLRLAEAKIRKGRLLSFREGNAEELPFEDGSFHAVTSAFSLRNLPRLEKSFQEARRVLLPGGTALFLDLTRPASKALAPFHKLYLTRIIPSLGGWISGHPEAYRYLADSILRFPDPEGVAGMLRRAGFSGVLALPLSGGIATLWRGTQ